ncbi:MAG TPA: MazG nucleotide pyrophosphohydrolase domain-containing protein [Anaerolineales bacterium]|nr:MazG nucleotide pyrophosphohydrolase domain-containing protein [Anaerolineales bacterium]
MNSTGNPFVDLAESTFAFYDRFDATPQVESASRNLLEEVNEFIEAAREGNNRTHIAEEAADVIVTTLGLCQASRIGIDELIKQIYAVIDKNNAKTHETHVYVDGKIRRK